MNALITRFAARIATSRRGSPLADGSAVVPETTGGRQAKENGLPESRHCADETLALLVTLLNSAPFGFALIDRSYRYIRVNDVMAEMHGVPAANHVGRAVAEIVPTCGPSWRQYIDRSWRPDDRECLI